MPKQLRSFSRSNPWVLVVILALAQTTSWGVLYYAFSDFVRPMQHQFGWSRAEITGTFSLAVLLSGITSVPLGHWLDRRGPRLLMTAGSCLATLLVLAWAGVGRLFQFYLIWCGIGLVMAAVLYEPAFAFVTVMFGRSRARALTVLTFIGGFASVIYLPLAGWLIQQYGWRRALMALALLLAIGTIPFHAIIPPRQAAGIEQQVAPENRRGATLRDAVRGRAFRWLTLAFCLNAVC